MEVKKLESDNRAEVQVAGEVDMRSSPELRAVLVELVKSKTPQVIVNLQGVTYIDSSGLATLVECLQGTSRYKGSLLLVGVNESIYPVFELARLDRVFEIRRTV